MLRLGADADGQLGLSELARHHQRLRQCQRVIDEFAICQRYSGTAQAVHVMLRRIRRAENPTGFAQI